MDNLKRQRTLLRSIFTRNANSINDLLINDPQDLDNIQVSFEILDKKAEELQDIDKEVRDLLLENENTTENDFLIESNKVDEYVITFKTIKLKVQKLLKTSDAISVDGSVHGPSSVSIASSTSNKKNFKLPKIELQKFDGNLINWLPFWSQFEKIHNDKEIVPEDKFQYLIQCIVPGTRAYDVVQSYPPIGSNYSKAIDSLKSRFGKDDLLVEVYVRELLKMVLQNALNNNKNQISLQTLYDKLESYLRNLETLGVTTDKCASILYPMVESCLPEELLRAWQRSSLRTGDSPQDRLSNLMSFMLSEVESEQRIGLAMSGFGVGSSHKFVKKTFSQKQTQVEGPPTAASLVSASRFDKPLTCIFCEKPHKSSDCFSAQKMSLDDKNKVLKEKKCCFCCLQPGHGIKRCKTSLKCPLCKKRHFLLMCPNLKTNHNASKPKDEGTGTKSESKENCVQVEDTVLANSSASSRPNSKVFMQTVVAKLRSPNNNTVVPVRLLFDTGSERSYIVQSLASRMQYEPLGNEILVHSLFGNVKTSQNNHQKYRAYLTSNDDLYKCNFEVLSQPTICGDISQVSPGPWIEELASKNINITDCGGTVLPVSILIGADIAGKLFTGNRLQLDSGLVAMQTLLGWTLMGKVPGETTDNSCLSSIVTNMFIKDADITDLWSLDLIGIKESPEHASKLEKELVVKKHFLETTTVNQEGRYEVRLPWVEDHPPLPTNKNLAEKRLASANKRLKANNLFGDYDAIFKDWLQQGIIEVVPSNELDKDKDCHYLPHRPVVKENSLTTRIRPVFDASAKEKHMPSLNDCLECGPNLIELIPTVMLRFREGRIGVIADIAKAFLQISINDEDTNNLRFLWYQDDCDEMIIYRHKRVVFGIKCSPFLLGAVIDLHLQKSGEKLNVNPHVVKKLQNSFYVDNVSASVDNLQELEEFMKDSRKIMADGKFDLRGWIATGHTNEEYESTTSNVLGIQWDFRSDLLFVSLDCLKDFDRTHITKREILSISHRVFDPIGFICPVMLYPKLLLQKLWNQKIDWDTKVDSKTADMFLKWFDELSALKEIKIPRWIGKNADLTGCTIHTFCDGSKDAYGTVIFLRVEQHGRVSVQMLGSKSRVAPLKEITISRLELLAATVGVRLTETIVKAMGWKTIPIYYWTDSTTVLGWIKQECNWKVFVWNRVSEIKISSKAENWNHIAGECNPADLPSRGCSAKYLLNSKWWEGPEWLKLSSENWPTKEKIIFDSQEIMLEKRKTVSPSETKCMINSDSSYQWYSQYFSDYTKVVRLVAWIYRFKENCRTKKDCRLSGELTTVETEAAENKLLGFIQKESFTGIDDEKISCLNPFIDELGLIRLKTKLSKKEDTTLGVRFPILLPAQHPAVKALILECHNKNCHAGVQILLNILRECYWILGGRRTVRSVISKCITCKRYNSKKLEAPAGTLPNDRMRDCAVFEVTGSDFAGPLYLKRNEKAWICIFTCAVYRAIHLELVTSLSSDAFLQALRRFIARRGRPSTIYSDNGTNYVGAKNLLDQIDWDEIKKISSVHHIHWKFIPPASPWWGGWWERLVRIVKELLRRVLGRACLDYQEMMTILCDCEAVINSRPLTYIYDGKEELSPLTPNHFLQDIRESGVPDLDKLDKTNLNRRLNYLQTLKEEIRQRFLKEYLGQLVQRNNKKIKNVKLQVGDVVLVECNNMKRVNWPLAVVEEVMPDKEGTVRVAKVKTSHGTLLRPIQKLYHLEMKTNDLDIIKKDEEENIEEVNEYRKEDKKEPEVKDNKVKTRSGRTVKTPKKYELC